MVIPNTQFAVQIVGPDEFVVATAKPVDPVGPHQMLMMVEACGICFSYTKLLHAFQHPRKSELAGGLSAAELREIPSYRPGAEPTVPGHEPVGRIVAVGARRPGPPLPARPNGAGGASWSSRSDWVGHMPPGSQPRATDIDRY